MTMARDSAGAEFARLLVRFDRPLLRYIMTFVPRRDDAEEVLQRTATVIWEKFEEFDRQREFLPWALRVAYFEVLNFRKQIARDRLVFREEVIEHLAETRDSLAPRLEAQRQALRQCLSELSVDDQTLLKRRYGDSETVAALADERGKTAKALYRRLDRLREMITRCTQRRMQLEQAGELA
ncbi:MAG: sigma-70 family RNA polymerase sigma factor [Planctomycetes bacterium]|nr:sigma-70 family RNA polymerase sigma factor [Planctomycetota bacterium]